MSLFSYFQGFLGMNLCRLRERLERLLPPVASADSRCSGPGTRDDKRGWTQTNTLLPWAKHNCGFCGSFTRAFLKPPAAESDAAGEFLVPGVDVFFHKYMSQFCSWIIQCSTKAETTRKRAAACVRVHVRVCSSCWGIIGWRNWEVIVVVQEELLQISLSHTHWAATLCVLVCFTGIATFKQQWCHPSCF